MSLMRRAHQGVPTQFGLGVSPSALVVGERAGYDLRSLVPVYTRVLREGYWLRAEGLSFPRRRWAWPATPRACCAGSARDPAYLSTCGGSSASDPRSPRSSSRPASTSS